MGWDGSGNFIRDNGANTGSSVWTQDKDANTKILSSYHDVHDEGIAIGLENCVTRDGQNSPTQNLPMANKRHTNVGAAVALTDYARVDQVQTNNFSYCGTTGTSTTYAASVSPNPTAYTAGLSIRVQFNVSCGDNPTLNLNGIGANYIYASPSKYIQAGRILANQFYDLIHDGSTGWFLVNTAPTLTAWTPSYGSAGGMTIGSITTNFANYIDRGESVEIFLSFDGTTGGTANQLITFSLPSGVSSAGYCSLSCVARDGGGTAFGGICYTSASTGYIHRYDYATWGLGAGRGAWISGVLARA